MNNIPDNQIVITGVPKSGTKLMAHMVHAMVPDWRYTVRETHFWKVPDRYSAITKHPHDIFKFDRLMDHIGKVPGYSGVVVMFRDPYFVLTSKHRSNDYWISAKGVGKNQRPPLDWYNEIKKVYEKWKEYSNVFFCDYESLIQFPNRVGYNIFVSFGFDLDHVAFTHSFSEYKDVPLPSNESEKFAFLKNPLDSARIELTDEDWEYINKQIKIEPELEKVRKELGYE